MKLKESATQEEVKKNYYALFRYYHPDRDEGIHQEKLKLLNEAYQVLSESEKRQEYDRIRVPEEETKEVKQKWEKVEREDEDWEMFYERYEGFVGFLRLFCNYPFKVTFTLMFFTGCFYVDYKMNYKRRNNKRRIRYYHYAEEWEDTRL